MDVESFDNENYYQLIKDLIPSSKIAVKHSYICALILEKYFTQKYVYSKYPGFLDRNDTIKFFNMQIKYAKLMAFQ